MKKIAWFVLLGVPVTVYVIVIVMMMSSERELVFPAPSPSDGNWNAHQFAAEDVSFQAIDGTNLHGWFRKHQMAKGTVLYCHGNGSHLGKLGKRLTEIGDSLESSVFIFDYRGFGKSEGEPTAEGVIRDAEAALQWVAKRTGTAVDDIVIYGNSLGGAVAVGLAHIHPPRLLVLERTFYSLVDVGAERYPWLPIQLILKNRFPSGQKLASFKGTLLQMHGSQDNVIPLESARRLFESCPSSQKEFVVIPGLGHNGSTPAVFSQLVAKTIAETQ